MPHKTIICVAGARFGPLPFNEAMLKLFQRAVECGVSPLGYRACLPDSERWKIWIARHVDRFATLQAACEATPQPDHNRSFYPDRCYLRDQDVVADPTDSTTRYVMSTQWGFAPDGPNQAKFIPKLLTTFSQLKIEISTQ